MGFWQTYAAALLRDRSSLQGITEKDWLALWRDGGLNYTLIRLLAARGYTAEITILLGINVVDSLAKSEQNIGIGMQKGRGPWPLWYDDESNCDQCYGSGLIGGEIRLFDDKEDLLNIGAISNNSMTLYVVGLLEGGHEKKAMAFISDIKKLDLIHKLEGKLASKINTEIALLAAIRFKRLDYATSLIKEMDTISEVHWFEAFRSGDLRIINQLMDTIITPKEAQKALMILMDYMGDQRVPLGAADAELAQKLEKKGAVLLDASSTLSMIRDRDGESAPIAAIHASGSQTNTVRDKSSTSEDERNLGRRGRMF